MQANIWKAKTRIISNLPLLVLVTNITNNATGNGIKQTGRLWNSTDHAIRRHKAAK